MVAASLVAAAAVEVAAAAAAASVQRMWQTNQHARVGIFKRPNVVAAIAASAKEVSFFLCFA